MQNNIKKINQLYKILPMFLVILIVCKRYGDIIVDNTNFSSPSKYILLIIMVLSSIIIMLNYKKIRKNHILIGFLLLIQFLITGNGVLLFSYISILALKNYDTNKVLKIYFFSNLIFFILMIVLNKIGLKPSIMIKTYDDLGFGNPNTTYISFYLVWLSYLFLNFEKNSWINKLILILTPIIMYSITHSRTGLITIFVTVILSLIIKYINFQKNSKINKLILGIFILIPIIITLISLIISYRFSDNHFLNTVLSTRPTCWSSYLKHSEKPLNLIGYNNDIRHTLMEGNVPLDSGYISGIYINGIIIYTLFIILYSYTIYTLCKKRDKKALILVLSILIYSFAETITLDLSTNISLLFMIQSLNNKYKNFNK